LRLILLLHEMVKKLPEVDYQRVAQIQQQLQQGTYNPDTKAVAEAVLRELGV
jgi:flagellar biosynthesis anti-sigma factor FlgM